MKTLKDLFIKENSYITTLKIDEEYHLYIEGLTENNEAIQDEEFNINNIKKFCIELFDEDYIETIESYDITLDEKLDDLKEKTKNLIESYIPLF